MGSLNPVFVLPSALPDPAWPAALAAAVTGSAGQLCTKPGLIVAPPAADGFVAGLGAAVAAAGPFERMLTPAMAEAHARWRTRAAGLGVVTGGAFPGIRSPSRSQRSPANCSKSISGRRLSLCVPPPSAMAR